MKFLVPNYSCLQNPLLGTYRPQIPVHVCPQSSPEFVELPPPPNKIPGYATDRVIFGSKERLAKHCEPRHCTVGSPVIS